MTTLRPGAPPPDDEVVLVLGCSRLGMRAAPPAPRLPFGWRRRRRG